MDTRFDIGFSHVPGKWMKMASGLPLAYDIMQKHEGTVTVENKVGHGTTFTIPCSSNKRNLNIKKKFLFLCFFLDAAAQVFA